MRRTLPMDCGGWCCACAWGVIEFFHESWMEGYDWPPPVQLPPGSRIAVGCARMIGQLRNLALGFGFAIHLVRGRAQTGAWRRDTRARNGKLGEVPRRSSGPRILVHGVSVGETNALQPLVAALADSPRTPDVVVSASTETGFARACGIHGPDRQVVRFPLDFTWMARRFLNDLQPDLVVLGELELWPTFLAECSRRGIPVCVAGGRMSARSYRGYRAWRPFVRPMFSRLALVAAQTESCRDRFTALGVPANRACVTGSLKWDAALQAPDAEAARGIAIALGIDPSRPLIVAGSTGAGEEEALLKHLPHDCQILLAPRNPDRWDEVARLRPGMPRRRLGRPDGALSRDPESSSRGGGAHAAAAPPPNVFLLDTIGELAAAYLLADAVFVGRSLAPMGGSNPLEPVALGKPTVIGPHHENFAGVVADLVAEGGVVVSARPMAVIARWLENPSAGETVAAGGSRAMARHQGTAARTAERVLGLLQGPDGRPNA